MSAKILIDRRELLVGAASAAAVAYLPFGVVAAPAVGAAQRELLSDWSIDDQWGVVPRWDAIPCVARQVDDARLAAVHPADLVFVA
jgi:hypothetical protein